MSIHPVLATCRSLMLRAMLFLAPVFSNAQTFSVSQSFGNGVVNPSCDWADFNNDGYVDLLVTGNNYVSQYPSTIPAGKLMLYQNSSGGSFSEVSGTLMTSFPAISNGAVAWGDYDRDGYMDFVVCGLIANAPVTYLYHNTGPTNGWKFTQQSIVLPGVSQGSASWDDFNNDGFPDLFLNGKNSSGAPVSYLLKNEGKANGYSFTSLSNLITGLYNSSSDWADYDRDGLDDLLVTGQQASGQYAFGVTLVYTNLGNGAFAQLVFSCNPDGKGNSGFNGNAEWGDYDNDGYVDILSVGSAYGTSWIYRNNSGNYFSHLDNAGIAALNMGRAHWGDCNNDGNLDVYMTGADSGEGGLFTAVGTVYVNNTNGTYTPLSNPGLDYYFNSNGSWADFDNDGDLDLFQGGNIDNNNVYNKFYKNNSGNAYSSFSSSPAPSNLHQGVIGNAVLLNWTQSGDLANTYNVYVGKSPSKIGSLSPASNILTGERLVVGPGNAGHTENVLLENLASGTYYWSVQSVNPAWQGSPFATGGTFVVPGNQSAARIQVLSGSSNFCVGEGPSLKAVSYPQADAWQWKLNGQNIPGANGQTYSPTTGGSYTVVATGNDNQGRYFSITSPALDLTAFPEPQAPSNPGVVQICSGQLANLTAVPGANGNICRWYDQATGVYVYQGNTLSVSPSANTNYTCYSYNTTNGCQSQAYSIGSVGVNPKPGSPGIVTTNCCNGNFTTLTATPPQGTQCQWYGNSSDTATLLHIGNTFTTPVLYASRFYYVAALDNTTGCLGNKMSAYVNVIPEPSPPIANDVLACTNGSVRLTATAGQGGTSCAWYKTPDDPQAFHYGLYYDTPPLVRDTMYFISSTNGNCEGDVRVPISVEMNPVFPKPIVQDQYGYVTPTSNKVKVTLFARPGAKTSTCRWYADRSKTQRLATSTTYTTPAIGSTQTYYVTSYDQTSGCEGDSIAVIKAIVVQAPARQVSPDQVYPVVSVPGDQNQNGINLCSGDVIQKYSLGTIQAGEISYDLKAMYNSRSVSMTPYYTNNALGGLGWKLLDYPKMVYDDLLKRYFYLDGTDVYPLDTLGQTGNTLNLRASGEAWLIQFALEGASLDISERKWTLTNENGAQFVFSNAPQNTLSDGERGNIWHLSKICDTQHQDSLTFSYSTTGMVTSILGSDGDQLDIIYSNNTISYISQYRSNGNNNNVLLGKTTLTYGKNFSPDASKNILTSIASSYNASLSVANGTQLVQSTPPLVFSYYNSYYPGALNSVQSPSGGILQYVYEHRVLNGHVYYPVSQTNLYSGTYMVDNPQVLDSLPTTFIYEGVKADFPYTLYNKVSVYPGNKAASLYASTLSTSFETGIMDPIFKDLSTSDLTKDQALTGKRSYLFDGVLDYRLFSKDFYLTNIEKHVAGSTSDTLPAQDSVTIQFYVYDTHQTLDVSLSVYYTPYDKSGSPLNIYKEDRDIDETHYGQWVLVSAKFPVLAGQVKFNFNIYAGGAAGGHDFYLDNVSLSGATITSQGLAEYYFFNGQKADSLLHLPDAYAEPYMTDSIKQIWFTGFEAGTNFGKWLTLHGGDCKPFISGNDATHNTAYAGSSALYMQSCQGGDKSYIQTQGIIIPSGTKRMKVAFRYSHSEIKGMKFAVLMKWNGGQKDTTITLDGSYLIDAGYRLYFTEFPVGGNADSLVLKISVTHTGASTSINNFYLDNLRVVCVGDARSSNGAVAQNNPADPILKGKLYCNRVLKANFYELNYQETCYYPTTLASGSKVALPRTLLTVEKSTGLNYSVLRYNSLGLPYTAVNTNELMDTLDKPFVQLMMRKFNYAAEFYPQLGSGQYYMPTIPALQQNLTKRLDQSEWQVVSATLTEWKNYSGYASKPIFEPWRTYNLVAPISVQGMDSVVNALKANPSWEPQSYRWAVLSNVLERNSKGLQVSAVNERGLQSYIQYSTETYTDPLSGKSLKTAPVMVASFGNAGPGNAFYHGFEPYEKMAPQVSGTVVTDFAFSGFNAARNLFSIGFNFTNSPASGEKYVCSFRAMPQTPSFTLNISSRNSGFIANQTFNCPDSIQGKWTYFELVFPVNVAADSLILAFAPQSVNRPSYFDDVRFGPAAGSFLAFVFNMVNGTLLCTHGNNSDYQRMTYGNASGATGNVRTGEVPVSLSASYFSRNGTSNHGKFVATDPNSFTSIVSKGGGTYYSFHDQYQKNQWSWSGGSMVNGRLKLQFSNSVQLKSSQLPANMADFGLSFTVAPDFSFSSAPEFNMIFNQFQVKFTFRTPSTLTVQCSKSGSTSTQNITLPYAITATPSPIDVVWVAQGTQAMLWVNGICVPVSVAWAASSCRGIKLSTGSSSVVWLSNICVFKDPLLSMTYSDGVAKTMQSQDLTSQGLIVSEVVYDRMFRPSVTTKPVLLVSQHSFGYHTDFISSFDWVSGVMNGEVNQANDYCDVDGYDDGYFYGRTDFENAPAALPSSEYQPGKDFASRTYSNWEKARHWIHDHPDEIISDAFYAFDIINMILVPEDAPLIILMDAAGLAISYAVGKIEDYAASKRGEPDAPEVPTTNFYYEQRSLPRLIKLPNANSVKSPQPTQVVRMEHDFLGGLSKITTPEGGSKYLVGDIWGNPRFYQDALAASEGKIMYTRYDAKGRIVEEGYFQGTWSYSELSAKRNDNTYPASAQRPVPLRKFLYDGAGGNAVYSATLRGRLSTELAFENGAQSFREDYTYSPEGQVMACAQSIVYQDIAKDSFNMYYGYDNLGNLTQINYPNIGGAAFGVRYTFNKMNLMDTVFTSVDGKLATYEWNPDGGLKKKRLYNSDRSASSFPTIYSYNAPSWLTNIFAGDTISNKPRFFNNKFDYNYLTDLWDRLGGVKYYNGNIASASYSPNSSTGLKGQETGYEYNEYGALDEYYSSIENEGVDAFDTETPFVSKFDLNGNITNRDLVDEGAGFSNSLKYKYHYNKTNNQLDRISYEVSFPRGLPSEWSIGDLIWGQDPYYHYDSTFLTHGPGGHVSQILYRSHKPVTTEKGKGALRLQTTNTFAFNLDNLLDSASFSDSEGRLNTCKFRYNTSGTRIVKDVRTVARGAGVSTVGRHYRKTYIRGAGGDAIAELVRTISGGPDTLKCYVMGGKGGIEAMYQHAGGGWSSWFVLTNNQGSTMQLVNRSDKSVTAGWNYDDYGSMKVGWCKNPHIFAYLYTGQEQDIELGTYNYKARIYAPNLRMFLSPDPAMSNPALPYAYVENDPVNNIDPTGMIPVAEILDAFKASEQFARVGPERVAEIVDHVGVESEYDVVKGWGPFKRTKKVKARADCVSCAIASEMDPSQHIYPPEIVKLMERGGVSRRASSWVASLGELSKDEPLLKHYNAPRRLPNSENVSNGGHFYDTYDEAHAKMAEYPPGTRFLISSKVKIPELKQKVAGHAFNAEVFNYKGKNYVIFRDYQHGGEPMMKPFHMKVRKRKQFDFEFWVHDPEPPELGTSIIFPSVFDLD